MAAFIETPSNRFSYSGTSTLYSLSDHSTSTILDYDDPPAVIKLPTNSFNVSTSFSDTSSITSHNADAESIKPLLPRGILGKIIKRFGSGAVEFVSEYALRKHLCAIASRIDLRNDGISVFADDQIRKFEGLYGDLLNQDYRGDKFRPLVVKLRLLIIRLLLNVETPRLFSRMQKNAFQRIWQDLDEQTLREEYEEFHSQACELKQSLLLRVVDELCSEQCLVLDTALDGAAITEILCKELAYRSGNYTIQNALERVAQTEWGFQRLLRLSLENEQIDGKPGTLIFDCMSRLLSYNNVFSCAMTIRIFGRLAQQNTEIFCLITGQSGVGWLVERLNELTYTKIYTKLRRRRGCSARAVERYCGALLVACNYGFADKVVQLGTTALLLRLVNNFTIRDQKFHGQIEENQHEDGDIERDQIACCELISYLLSIPSAKRRLLLGTRVLRAFNAHPNRLFSDQKLLATLAVIMKQLEE